MTQGRGPVTWTVELCHGRQMSSELTSRLVPAAIDAFTDKVSAVPADRWNQPTPDTEWTVRDLVNHVTGEHLWVPHLLGGETLEQVGDRYDGDVLGDDQVTAWITAADASRKAWLHVQPGLQVHLSSGLTPVDEYAAQMHLDLVIHGWDLARGAALDDSIDPDVAQQVLDYVAPLATAWSAAGLFAAPVEGDFTEPRRARRR